MSGYKAVQFHVSGVLCAADKREIAVVYTVSIASFTALATHAEQRS